MTVYKVTINEQGKNGKIYIQLVEETGVCTEKEIINVAVRVFYGYQYNFNQDSKTATRYYGAIRKGKGLLISCYVDIDELNEDEIKRLPKFDQNEFPYYAILQNPGAHIAGPLQSKNKLDTERLACNALKSGSSRNDWVVIYNNNDEPISCYSKDFDTGKITKEKFKLKSGEMYF